MLRAIFNNRRPLAESLNILKFDDGCAVIVNDELSLLTSHNTTEPQADDVSNGAMHMHLTVKCVPIRVRPADPAQIDNCFFMQCSKVNSFLNSDRVIFIIAGNGAKIVSTNPII